MTGEPVFFRTAAGGRMESGCCKSVLVVDSSESIRAMVRYALTGKYVVQEAANGIDALGLLQRTPCACIIADRDLPDMSGMELTRRIRARRVSIPTIVLIPDSDWPPQERLDKNVCGEFLAKPFHPRDLLQTVARLTGTFEEEDGLSVQAVLDALPHPAMVLDEDHRVWMANGSFYRLTGTGIGDCFVDCGTAVHGPSGAPVQCPLDESRRTGEPVQRIIDIPPLGRLVVGVYPMRATAPDGSKLYLHVTKLAGDCEDDVARLVMESLASTGR